MEKKTLTPAANGRAKQQVGGSEGVCVNVCGVCVTVYDGLGIPVVADIPGCRMSVGVCACACVCACVCVCE